MVKRSWFGCVSDMNKQAYIKPECEVIELEYNTPMMAESTYIGFNPDPAEPDAPGRRGEWGNLWNDNGW